MSTHWNEERLEALAVAADYLNNQMRLAGTGLFFTGAVTGVPAPAGTSPGPREEILAALSEPLGLPGASLPAYGVPRDGYCRACLLLPVYSQGLCVYDQYLLDRDAPCEQDLRDRDLGRTVVLMLLLTLGMLALLWAAGVIT